MMRLFQFTCFKTPKSLHCETEWLTELKFAKCYWIAGTYSGPQKSGHEIVFYGLSKIRTTVIDHLWDLRSFG